MSVSSEHEFEGRVSRELSGEIFGWCHVRIQENLDDVTRSPKINFLTWQSFRHMPNCRSYEYIFCKTTSEVRNGWQFGFRLGLTKLP